MYTHIHIDKYENAESIYIYTDQMFNILHSTLYKSRMRASYIIRYFKLTYLATDSYFRPNISYML